MCLLSVGALATLSLHAIFIARFRLPPCSVKRTREAKDRDKEREGNAVQRERDGAEGEENMRRPLLGEG